MDEQRLIELETKIAHQEHLIGVLNETVTRQELTLHQLREAMAVLAKRMKESVDAGTASLPHEKPPHY
jgi:SlyX protein